MRSCGSQKFIKLPILQIIFIIWGTLFLSSCLKETKNGCSSDEYFSSATRKCVVKVESSNFHAPVVGSDQTIVMTEATVAQAFSINVAEDVDGDDFTYIVTQLPTRGVITGCLGLTGSVINNDISCTYTKNDVDDTGNDTFKYKVNDGIQDSETQATVTFQVTAENDVPTITDVSMATDANENTAYDLSFDIDEGGGASEDGQVLSVTVTSSDETVIPLTSILIYFGTSIATSTYKGTASGSDTIPVALEDGVISEDAGLAANNLYIRFTSGLNATGASNLTVTITDGTDTASDVVAVTVISANDLPEFRTTPVVPQVISEGGSISKLSFKIDEGGDDDAAEDFQALSVKVVVSPTDIIPYSGMNIYFTDVSKGAPDGATYLALGDVDAADGTLQIDFTPAYGKNGDVSVTVYVLDDGAPAQEQSFNFIITVSSDNASPTVATIADQIGTEDTTLSNLAFQVDEGGDTDEDPQTVLIQISSSDQTKVKDSDITVYYSGTQVGTGGSEIDLTSSEPSSANIGESNVSLDLKPIDNANGSVTITVDVTDSEGATGQETFLFTIASDNDTPTITFVSDQILTVNEGSNIANYTLSIDEGGGSDEDSEELTIEIITDNTELLPLSSVKIYNYTKATSDYASNGVFTFDSAVGDIDANLYQLRLDITPKIGLIVTEANKTGTLTVRVTDNGSGTKSVDQTIQITRTDISALMIGWDNVKSVGPKKDYSGGVVAQGYVGLEWDAMTLLGDTSSISKYIVYRSTTSISTEEEDFSILNTSSSDSACDLGSTPCETTTTTFQDNNVVEGQTYFYVVRPVASNEQPVDINETFREIAVVAPIANLSLVHHWIANREICERMGNTIAAGTIDPNNDFRCLYKGPGDVTDGALQYYQLTKDYLVQTYEASCNFTETSCGGDPGCIGTQDPTVAGVSGSSDGDVYYARNLGLCYINVSGVWKEINQQITDDATIYIPDIDPIVSLKPPLTNIEKDNAVTYCTKVTTPSLTGATAAAYSLMTRKIQVAAFAWGDEITDIETSETGVISPPTTGVVCNTDNGGASTFVDAFFTDADYTSYNIDSMPGLLSSTIRSYRTGSKMTEGCVSKYGIQDHVGNVREWASDVITCTGHGLANNAKCNVVGTGFDNGSSSVSYHFDGSDVSNGPCGDSDDDNACDDGPLASWLYSAMSYKAEKFFIPLGLPADDDVTIATGVMDISSISTALYSDQIVVDGDLIDAVVSDEGYTTSGGSYNNGGNSAGRYVLEFVPDGDTTEKNSYTGFRCMSEVSIP